MKASSQLQLSAIYCYPIKSLGGVALTSSQIESRGLQYDRRWMLVDEQGCFLSQRTSPQMAHLQVDIGTDYLNIRQRQNGAQLQIPITEEAYSPLVKVKVWKDELDAGLATEAINAWFSSQLGQRCRLVRMKSESERHTESDYVGKGQVVSLADGYPILLASEASLDHLNQQLEHDISMLRFRPNLVVSGGIPFQEDHWNHFQIGTAHFKGVKSCSRCQVITIDPETAESGKEPLRTLATYRTFNKKVKFGENVCWEGNSGDLVQVGDTVTVHSNKQVQYHQPT